MRGKPIYCDEWVKVKNLMNKYFAAARPCSQCLSLSCASVWYSVKTKEVRCVKCFDAEAEHWAIR